MDQLDKTNLPRHIAIIMDGNGRWARERRMPRPFGHRSGMRAVREVVEGAVEVGLEAISLFAFSQENWQRPTTEITALMSLLEEYIARDADELHARGVRVVTFGKRSMRKASCSNCASAARATISPVSPRRFTSLSVSASRPKRSWQSAGKGVQGTRSRQIGTDIG